MYLIWGPVPLRVSRLLACEAEAVFDPTGCDYLWTDYTVSVEGMWGRNADGYTVAAMTPEGPIPALIAGPLAGVASGIQAVTATRHALSQRAAFALYDINVQSGLADILLASPGVDAANGPVMIEPPSVQSVHGSGGLVFVRCTFKVSVCDCAPLTVEIRGSPNSPPLPFLTGGPKVVKRTIFGGLKEPDNPTDRQESANQREKRRLSEFFMAGGLVSPPQVGDGLRLPSLNGQTVCRSNRWTTSVSYDEQTEAPVYRLVGQAIFRRDALQLIGVSTVDQFRGSLLPVMPINCKREVNDISLSGDGLTLSYDVTDRRQVRSYVDWRMAKSEGGAAGFLNGIPSARNIANVSLVSRREYRQPGVGNGLFEFIDHLSTVNFAHNPDSAGGKGEDLIPGVGEGKRAGRMVFNMAIAGLRTLNSSLLPTAVESAVAEVQITPDGTLADAQSLALALVAGVIGPQLQSKQLGGRADPVAARFAAFPPNSQLVLECDHVRGVVRCTQVIEQSGLVDFLLQGQQSVAQRLLSPYRDEVVGGRNTVGVFNIMDALGLLPAMGALVAAILPGLGGLADAAAAGVAKLLDDTLVNRFADELLVTDADVILRGPNGDNYSRSAVDLLIRSAQLILRPCQTPLAPANTMLDPFPQGIVSEVRASQPPAQPPPGPKPGDKPTLPGGLPPNLPDQGLGGGNWQNFLHGDFPVPIIR